MAADITPCVTSVHHEPCCLTCKDAFTPVRRGFPRVFSERFLHGSSVYTSAGPRAVSLCRSPILWHWAFILTNQRSLFLRVPQKNYSVSDLGGRPQRTSCGGSVDPRRCKQHHTISTNRSTAESAGGIRAGVPRVFPRWCKCPLG